MPTAPGQKPFPYPCHVINLERQPERLAEFRRWNADCGLTIERFPAVDGSALDEAARRQVSLMDSTPGTIGNAAAPNATPIQPSAEVNWMTPRAVS